MRTGERLTLVIERPAAGGRMIARHDGAVIFVAGAIPGETVDAEIERVQSGIGWAATRTVIEPSPDRLVGLAESDCGGAVLAHMRYERQLDIKRAIIEDGVRRIGHLTLPQPIEVVASPIDNYRMRARLHVRKGRVGFFREGTHDLCDPRSTRQLLTESLDAVQALAAALTAADRTFEGEIDLSENIPATERAVHLEVSRSAIGGRLATRMQPLPEFVGASFAIGNEARTRELWGSPVVTDILNISGPGDAKTMTLVRHARAFFQSNRFLVERLVDHVISFISRGSILDLYAGVGLFSIAAALAGHGDVLAVEGDDVAAANLRRNAAQCAGGVRVRSESVEGFLGGAHVPAAPSTVIVDPPRTGLSKDAVERLTRLRAPRLVYVSCDVATLARDARVLCEGGYAVENVRAFDLFPQTAHVETVIVFSR